MQDIPVLLIDVIDYTQHSDPVTVQLFLQEELKQCEHFMITQGEEDSKLRRHGTGDGYYLLFDGYSPQVALKYALDLDARLTRFCANSPELPIRLLMVLAQGDVKRVGDQYVGEVLSDSARFLDGQELRTYQDQTWATQKAATVLAITNVFYNAWRRDPNRHQQSLMINEPSWQDYAVTDKQGMVRQGKIWDRWQAAVPKVPAADGLAFRELFVGRQRELKRLNASLNDVTRQQIIHIRGIGGIGKTTLAREAIHRFGGGFDQVLELLAKGHTPISFAKALTLALGQDREEAATEEDAKGDIAQLLGQQRILLYIDNISVSLALLLPRTRSRILITSRDQNLINVLRQRRPDLELEEIPLALFSEAEAQQLFAEVLGGHYQAQHQTEYGTIAKHLGNLPVALRLAANLMVFPPNYSASELSEALAKSLLGTLDQADAASTDLGTLRAVFQLGTPQLDEAQLALLQLMAVCAQGPVPLSFLDALQGAEVRTTAEQLSRHGWCRRLEGEPRRYELHVLVRELLRELDQTDTLLQRFLVLIEQTYASDALPFTIKEAWLAQCRHALMLWKQKPDPRQKQLIYAPFREFCAKRGYGALYVSLADQVLKQFPQEKQTRAVAMGNKALILIAWGKLEDAMALLMQQEALKLELGDRAGLARSYGNQAVILMAWGKLEDAMALHKQVEALMLELGDRAGLAISYGNQAVILMAWGKLEDAMALLKQQEALTLELGDRAGLAASYGNQALILRDRGKLEDAMALHKQQEALTLELGDRAGLARSYGNQALILSAWGKREDAMALHKQEEALKLELGDRAGLARCWWNRGNLYLEQGDQARATQLLQKAIATNKELGIPTETMEQELAPLVVTISFNPPGATLHYQDTQGLNRQHSPAIVPRGLTFQIFDWFHHHAEGCAEKDDHLTLTAISLGQRLQSEIDLTSYTTDESFILTARKIRLLLQRIKPDESFVVIDEWARQLRQKAPAWFGTWLVLGVIELTRKRPQFALLYFAMVKRLYPNSASAFYFEAVSHGLLEDLGAVEADLHCIAEQPLLARDFRENVPLEYASLEDPFFDEVRAISHGDKTLKILAEMLKSVAGSTERQIPTKESGTEASVPLSLQGIAIEKVHSFKACHFILPQTPRWLFLTGDNAEGKTSFLHALALGLQGGNDPLPQATVHVWLQNNEDSLWYGYDRGKKSGGQPKVIGYGPIRLALMPEMDDEVVRTALARPLENLLKQKGSLLNVEQYLKDLSLEEGGHDAKNRLSKTCKLLAQMMPTVEEIRLEGSQVTYHSRNQDMTLYELSAGNRAVLGLVGDMLIRLLHMQPDATRLEDLEGIVLIDEFETHLHPRTQYELPQKLSTYFPKVQVIASTHSPLPLLGSPKDTNVIRVHQNEQGESILEWQDALEIDRLTPNNLLTSPAFGFTDLFSRLQTDVRQVHTEDFHDEIEGHKQRDAFLQDEALSNVLPDSFFDEDEP